MNNRVLFAGLLILMGTSLSFGIDFSRVNLAWQYDLGFEVQMSHRVVQDEEGIQIFIRVSSDSLSSWQYNFFVQRGYEAEEDRALISYQIDTLRDSKKEVFLKMKIGRPTEGLMFVEFHKSESSYYYDINLKVGNLSFSSIYPVDKSGFPILENYINRSGYSWKGSESFIAMEYSEAFPPADPPMAEMKPLAPRVDLDSSFVFKDSVSFEENHFYTVRKDSLATVGLTILRVPAYFPKYRQLGELLDAMLYLTSEQEKKSIIKSSNPKKSFDSFWMNTYSTKSRARNAIRAYYNRVEKSNLIFTNFKSGWKTDRGMIYIIFGVPDEVYRTTNSEEWYYDNGDAFEFTIISSFFAPKTYSLRRNNGLEQLWYSQIAAIRQSINE